MHIHIFGASGTGTTTLGKALGEVLNIPHFDTDDFYWKQTEVPFSEKQPPAQRLASLQIAMEGQSGYVLSGSMCSWGDPLIPCFSHMIFLTADWETRHQRLLHRERARYGEATLQPGGTMHQIHENFIAWASRYDEAGLEQRSRQTHEAWIAALPNSIRLIRLTGEAPPQVVLEKALHAFRALNPNP